jgi:hypothetical protein
MSSQALVHSSNIQNSQKVEMAKCLSIDEWTKVICPYNGILFSREKEGSTNMCDKP